MNEIGGSSTGDPTAAEWEAMTRVERIRCAKQNLAKAVERMADNAISLPLSVADWYDLLGEAVRGG